MKRRTFIKALPLVSAALASPRLTLSQSPEGEFELRAARGEAALYGDRGGMSDLMLYNGRLPGPEIRVQRGQRLRVRFINELDEPSSVHWHGIRIDNAMDGVPGLTQDAVPPGGEFLYDFHAPDAGTFWYHAHRESWRQVTLGLSGPLIVEEKEPSFDRDHDLVLMLNDWRLDENGVFEHDSMGSPMHWSHDGRLGNWLTINGQDLPEFPMRAGHWYRLRLINSSSSRVLEIDPRRFDARLLGYDGQCFGEPRSAEGVVQLAPSQRLDLVMRPQSPGRIPFEMMTGQPYRFADFVVVEGTPAATDPPWPQANGLPQPHREDALDFRLVMEGGAMSRMESLTYQGEKLEGRRFLETRQFWGFNGVAGMTESPLFEARRAQSVYIDIENRTAFPHAMHLHGFHFRVVSRDGEGRSDSGGTGDWRDTVLVQPRETVQIGFVADNPGKWLLHCHMLEHAAAGMMSWFRVS